MSDPVLKLLHLPRDEQIKALCKITSDNARMKSALESIAEFVRPEDARESGEAEAAGLDFDEWVEMAYENAITTAELTIRDIEQ